MSYKLSVQHVRVVAAVAAAAGLILVGLGGYVRGTGAGLACPDWPLCYGRLVPHELGGGIAQEVGHRYLASVVSLLAIAFATLAYANRVALPRLWEWSRIILLILAAQVVLGGLTVLLLLNPFIVTGHLAFGTVFVQMLALAAVDRPRARREHEPLKSIKRTKAKRRGTFPSLVLALGIVTFAQVLLGGFVGSSGASLSCPDFPGCFPKDFPAYGWAGPQYVQMFHRVLAFAILFGAAALTYFAPRICGPEFRGRGHLLGVTFMIALQMVLGISNVYMGVPVSIAVSHLLLAQLILFSIFSYYRRLRPELSLYRSSRDAFDDLELGEYTPTKRRFVANLR